MAKALQTIWQVKIIDKKEFAKKASNDSVEAFVIYVTFFSLKQMTIYLTQDT